MNADFDPTCCDDSCLVICDVLKQTKGACLLAGAADDFILTEWGKNTAEKLSSLGVEVQFETVPGVAHMLDKSMVDALALWLAQKFEL